VKSIDRRPIIVNVAATEPTKRSGSGRFSALAIWFRSADRLADASAKPG